VAFKIALHLNLFVGVYAFQTHVVPQKKERSLIQAAPIQQMKNYHLYDVSHVIDLYVIMRIDW